MGIDSAVAPLPLQSFSSRNVRRSMIIRLNKNMARRLARPLKNDRLVEETIRWPIGKIHLGICCVRENTLSLIEVAVDGQKSSVGGLLRLFDSVSASFLGSSSRSRRMKPTQDRSSSSKYMCQPPYEFTM